MRIKEGPILIDKAELMIVRMPLLSPFETSFGRETHKTAIIVSLHSDGLVGYSECVASEAPYYSYETVTTAWHVIEDYVLPNLLGKEFSSPEALMKSMARIRGHNMAKASVEMAFWDLVAKANRISLSKALGGVKERIESGVSIGIQESMHKLINMISKYMDEGYRRIKIKIKPRWDVEVVKEVRKVFPDIPLMVDANSAYTLDDIDVFKEIDRYDLMMVEQPLSYDDIVDHAKLQSQISTPICLDESIKSYDDARHAIELGSCRIINIKPGRVGGHLISKTIHDYCMDEGIPVWMGGMLETGIGRAHNVALASLPNFKLPGDVSASDRYFEEDIVEPPFKLNPDGTIDVPKGHGIGVEVMEERIEKFRLKKRTFK